MRRESWSVVSYKWSKDLEMYRPVCKGFYSEKEARDAYCMVPMNRDVPQVMLKHFDGRELYDVARKELEAWEWRDEIC